MRSYGAAATASRSWRWRRATRSGALTGAARLTSTGLYGSTTAGAFGSAAATDGRAAFVITGFFAAKSISSRFLLATVSLVMSPRASRRPRVARPPARFVHADLGADLLHRHFAVVVEADHLPLAPRQRLNRRTHAIARLGALVGGIRRLGLRGHQRGRQRAFVEVFAGGEGR